VIDLVVTVIVGVFLLSVALICVEMRPRRREQRLRKRGFDVLPPRKP
jgi:hypothetical protein